MRQMSSDIRSKPDWVETINDADTRAGWATEAKAKELADVEFAYVLDKLVYYASLHPPGSNVRLSAADGVWFSDMLIDSETTNKFKDYAAILESIPDRQKDWYPNDRSRVLNLIDPPLFPLIYGRLKLCRQAGISPQAALKLGEASEFPGSLDEWHKALHVAGSELDYYLPTGDWRCFTYISNEFSWLLSEFRVDDNGAVTIESYINNLHLIKYAALYPIIARVLSKFLPLLEHVVTDLAHPRQPRVIPDRDKYYKSDEPLPNHEGGNYYEELILWKSRVTFVYPQPEPLVVPARPVNPYKPSEQQHQTIVTMANIELASKRPIYGGEDWSVAGLANERIITTGIFFYDVANTAPTSLRFHEALFSLDFEVKQYDIESIVKAYGIERDKLVEGDPVFVHQFKVPELKLADKTKPGHCKMPPLYFVHPSTRIPSTEIVPPQQQD
ncbi:hypothetical protein GGI17_004794 [Coemansia sp. S146]|nr:hypothetical protein GGI17_004794 [Coemansia sp. S146]